ncbi:MAG: hypothetical protein MJZ81_07330 [Bacteroidales bacterium]|nr:hypothetical protein [Bacteroidales bacterium]
MSDSMKNLYEVLRILRASVLEAFAAFHLEGWNCMEFAQSRMTSGDKVVLIQNTKSRRVGFQGFEFKRKPDGGAYRVDDWLEEQTWTFTIVAKRPVDKTTGETRISGETIVSEDVGSMLQTWFNGPGALRLREKAKFGVLRVPDGETSEYKDDSDVSQKKTVLSVNVQVPKEFSFDEEAVAGLNEGIYHF